MLEMMFEKAVISKRDQRKAIRRAVIVEIAQKNFLDNGYSQTTMSSIAQAMGGSKGTLWSHFDSKEALFEAVIDRFSANFRIDLTTALNPKTPTEAGLLDFAETFMRKITRSETIALQRMVVGEAARFPELGSIVYTRAVGVTRDLLSDYISVRMETGVLRKGDPTRAAQMLLSLCVGGHCQRILWGVEDPRDATVHDEAKAAVEHFLRAYGS